MSLPDGADTTELDAEVNRVWADADTHVHIRGFLERTFGKATK